jgi:hypothetical protein
MLVKIVQRFSPWIILYGCNAKRSSNLISPIKEAVIENAIYTKMLTIIILAVYDLNILILLNV